VFERGSVASAPESGSLSSFCLDEKDAAWVVKKTDHTNEKLIKVPTRNGTPCPPSDRVEFSVPFKAGTHEVQITAGKDGLIWYADSSIETALTAFDTKLNKWTPSRPDAPEFRCYSLSKGCDGTLWAGGEEMIFRTTDNEKPILYTRDNLQLPQVPLSLYEAKDHRLWVIGRVGYVYSVDIGTEEWMTYEKLHFQCEAADGTQWFREKSLQAAVSYNPQSEKWTEYNLTDGLIDRINVIFSTSHGLIWAAGGHENRAAFSVFDGKKWKTFHHPEFAT